MKIKQTLFITHPEEFVKGDFSICFGLYGNPLCPGSWINCGEIELDIDDSKIDQGKILARVVKGLDDQIENERLLFAQRLQSLQAQRKELLALPYQGESE